MRHKAKWYLVLALGFLAGVAFVISCGQEARSTAEEVLAAIGITFDPTGTDLSAQNLQDLGTELDTRIITQGTELDTRIVALETMDTRLVALETKVGSLPSPTPDLSGRVADLEAKIALLEGKDLNLESRLSYYEPATQSQISNNEMTNQIRLISARLECLEEELGYSPTPADWVALDSQTHAIGSVTLNLVCPKSLRYLKIEATYTSDMGQVNIYEIQAFGPDAPTTNLALSKTATANSNESNASFRPNDATDGNSNSRWSSNRSDPGPASVAVPHWIMVDLGQNYKINQIVINVGNYNEDYTLLGKRE